MQHMKVSLVFSTIKLSSGACSRRAFLKRGCWKSSDTCRNGGCGIGSGSYPGSFRNLGKSTRWLFAGPREGAVELDKGLLEVLEVAP